MSASPSNSLKQQLINQPYDMSGSASSSSSSRCWSFISSLFSCFNSRNSRSEDVRLANGSRNVEVISNQGTSTSQSGGCLGFFLRIFGCGRQTNSQEMKTLEKLTEELVNLETKLAELNLKLQENNAFFSKEHVEDYVVSSNETLKNIMEGKILESEIKSVKKTISEIGNGLGNKKTEIYEKLTKLYEELNAFDDTNELIKFPNNPPDLAKMDKNQSERKLIENKIQKLEFAISRLNMGISYKGVSTGEIVNQSGNTINTTRVTDEESESDLEGFEAQINRHGMGAEYLVKSSSSDAADNQQLKIESNEQQGINIYQDLSGLEKPEHCERKKIEGGISDQDVSTNELKQNQEENPSDNVTHKRILELQQSLQEMERLHLVYEMEELIMIQSSHDKLEENKIAAEYLLLKWDCQEKINNLKEEISNWSLDK